MGCRHSPTMSTCCIAIRPPYAADFEGGIHPREPRARDRLAVADRALSPRDERACVPRRPLRRDRGIEVPPLRRRARAGLPRPRQRAAVERLPQRSGAERAGDMVPAARARVRALLAGADRGPRRPRRTVQRRLRLLQLVLDHRGWRTPRPTCEAMRERFGLRLAASSCEVAANDGYLLQFVASARHSRATASSRRRARRRRRARKGSRSSSASSGSSLRTSWPRPRQPGRPDRGQQRARPCAGYQRFRRRLRAAAETRRRRDLRVPAPAAARAREPVRHHLPRALLVSVAGTASSASSQRNGLARVRRRGAADARRQPARLRPARRHRDAARRTEASIACCATRTAARRRDAAGYYAGFQERIDQVKDDFVALPDRGAAGRQEGRRLRRRRQRQHADELRRRPARPIAFVVDRNPAKQGKLHAGQPHPDRRRGALRQVRPDDIVLLPWNLRDESWSSSTTCAPGVARFVTAVPRLECT